MWLRKSPCGACGVYRAKLLTHYENPPAQLSDVVVPMLRGE